MDVCLTLILAFVSPVSDARCPLLCDTGVIWVWPADDRYGPQSQALKATVLVQSDRLFAASFINFFFFFFFSRVTICRNKLCAEQQLLGCCVSAGSARFPPTPTLCSQSALPFYERRSSCSARSDTPGKELWHGVISSGHTPSADVRKQSHSCRWNFVVV